MTSRLQIGSIMIHAPILLPFLVVVVVVVVAVAVAVAVASAAA